MVDAIRQLRAKLLPVRRRISRRSMFHAAVMGLLVGASAVFLLAILRWFGVSITAWIAWLIPLATTAVGAVVGAFRRPSFFDVARRVDRVYCLKDRTLTALRFVSGPEDPYRRLQVEDALQHLESIDPTKVVPVLVPRALPMACLLLVVSWSTLIASGARDSLDTVPLTTPDFLLQLADDLGAAFAALLIDESSMPASGEVVSKTVNLVQQKILLGHASKIFNRRCNTGRTHCK